MPQTLRNPELSVSAGVHLQHAATYVPTDAAAELSGSLALSTPKGPFRL